MTCGNTLKTKLASGSRDHIVGILRNDNICGHPLVDVAANRYAVRARQRYFLWDRTDGHGFVHFPIRIANDVDVV